MGNLLRYSEKEKAGVIFLVPFKQDQHVVNMKDARVHICALTAWWQDCASHVK